MPDGIIHRGPRFVRKDGRMVVDPAGVAGPIGGAPPPPNSQWLPTPPRSNPVPPTFVATGPRQGTDSAVSEDYVLVNKVLWLQPGGITNIGLDGIRNPVSGPISTTPGNAVLWDDATGNLLADAGWPPAPLVSPQFTGSPTAPTPPTLDSSNAIATTSFVENLLQFRDAPADGSSYVRNTNKWVSFNGASVGASPPSIAGNGSLWWDSNDGQLYVYYDDGNSKQWVVASSLNSIGGGGYLPLGGGTLTGLLTGPYFQATSYGPYGSQGAYLMWNRVGDGLTDFVNNRGLGLGGFNFIDTDGTNDISLFSVTRNGAAFGIHTTVSGGLDFGSVIDSSPDSAALHLSLWGTTFGIGVTNSQLNYFVGVGNSHHFRVGGSDIMYINGGGIGCNQPLYLPADPTVPLEAATKQYVDAHAIADAPNNGNAYMRASAGWSSGGTLTQPLTLTATGAALTVGPGIIVTPQINTALGADLVLPQHLQCAGLTFWPPGGGITWSGAQTPYINVGHTLVGSTTSTGIVAPYLFTLNADTVSAQPVNSMSWFAINGNVGNPNVWTTSHAYGVGTQVANGGRLYNCTTAGTSAASGNGPSGTGTGITDGTAVWSYTAPNAVGDRSAIFGQITVASAPGDILAGRAGGAAIIAVGGHTQLSANMGGTNLTTAAAGAGWGANFLVTAGAGATNLGEVIGAELNIACMAGSSTKNKVGLQIVQTSTDAVSATNGDDICVLLANQSPQGTAPGWTYGISFGSPSAAFPMKAAGTLIGAGTNSGTLNASIGIDFSGVTFANYSLRMPNFVLTPSGTAQFGGASQNALQIIPGGTTSSDITFQQQGAGQFQFNGNIITNAWLSANSNSSYLQVGATNAIRMFTNNGTQPEIDVVGSAKLFFNTPGGVQINGPFGLSVAPIPKQTITGAKGGNAALSSLLGALAAYGFITDSTTA